MSSGQNGDSASQTNVYAKQFASNASLASATTLAAPQRYNVGAINESLIAAQQILTTDSPANHVVATGGPYDGVVMVTAFDVLGEEIGSGSLLSNGLDILTDAHVVWDDVLDQPVANVDVTFNLPTGAFTISSSDIIVNPGWNPNAFGVGDVAIIVLPQLPAAGRPAVSALHRLRGRGDEPGRHHRRLWKYGHRRRGRDPELLRREAFRRERVRG